MEAKHLKVVRHIRCQLCGETGLVLHEGLTDHYYGTPGLWTLRRCQSVECGFIWLDPAPRPEDLHLAYSKYFTHGSTGNRLRNLLLAFYRLLTGIPSQLTGLAADRARLGTMFLNGLPPGNLLDVGCGDGAFLSQMTNLGWRPHGVDFDTEAIAAANRKYGLRLCAGNLAECNFGQQSFDAITMSHVIEHVPDANSLLSCAKQLLRPEGRLIITTPNSSSWGHVKYGRYWFGLDAPRHVQLFNSRNLQDLVSNIGFRVIDGGSTAARADIFIGASEAIRASKGEAIDHQPRVSLWRAMKAIRGQYWEHYLLQRDNTLGEELFVVAIPS